METGIDFFDWKYYLSLYEDLRKAGIDNYRKAWKHWVKFGKNEGRMCSKEQENTELVILPVKEILPENVDLSLPEIVKPEIFPNLVVKVPPKVLEINTKKPAAKRTPAPKKPKA